MEGNKIVVCVCACMCVWGVCVCVCVFAERWRKAMEFMVSFHQR